jgi:uncharacterized protein
MKTERAVGPLFATAVAMLTLLPWVGAARAAPASQVLDCPLRDAPLSVESPFIDVLLNPAARAMAQEASGKDFSTLPPLFTGTTPPTFAAIVTLREAVAFAGGEAAVLPALDARLRALPVTDADRRARCARYDDERPALGVPRGKPALLLFEKINGFKDTPSVDAARAALQALAAREGWTLVVTDKAGVFTPRQLRRFAAVVWNNISGDVLTLSQRRAFQDYLQRGGGFVGLHGSAGDPAYFWDWYADGLLGARFAGHPTDPQFQEARITVDTQHPLAAGLPAEWRMTDEWYSFRSTPRAVGAQVVLSLDESSYTRVSQFGGNLTMGDHPLAWSRCIGRGRMFYSAIGHLPETYAQPQHVTLLTNALRWVVTAKGACHGG